MRIGGSIGGLGGKGLMGGSSSNAKSQNITIVYDNDKPIQVLNNLIEKRKELLGEITKDAVIATAITVLKSLRADAKIAPATAKPKSYVITDTGYVGGWERKDGKFHRVVRVSPAPKAKMIHNIHPVNLAGQKYVKGEVVRVYKVVPQKNTNMMWEKTKHKGCWYVFAQSQKVVEDFAKRHMTKRIERYRGLAKGTLGFAMAAVSSKGGFASEVKSAKARAAAKASYKLSKEFSKDNFTLTFMDLLNYSTLAQKSGSASVARAMMKAANAITARLNKVADAKLAERIPTPFPEAKGG